MPDNKINISTIKTEFDKAIPETETHSFFGCRIDVKQRLSILERKALIDSVVTSAIDSGAPFICFDYIFNYCLFSFLTNVEIEQDDQTGIDELLTSSDVMVFFESATRCDPYELREAALNELKKQLRKRTDPLERLVNEVTAALDRFAPEDFDLNKFSKKLDGYMKVMKSKNETDLAKGVLQFEERKRTKKK